MALFIVGWGIYCMFRSRIEGDIEVAWGLSYVGGYGWLFFVWFFVLAFSAFVTLFFFF